MPTNDDPKYLSRIRTNLDKLLLRLERENSGQSVKQAIESEFPAEMDGKVAMDMYEHRDLLWTENASPTVVWHPIVAESAMTEFLPQGPALARGATSEIYICETRFSKITFVVKLLVHDRQRIMTSLALRELQALIGRRHPNVVSVLDAGHLHIADGEQYPYVAMEKLDGVTLYEWFEKEADSRRGKGSTEATQNEVKDAVFNATIAAKIVSVLANAIQFCHEDKVTHGDVSPINVMVCGQEPTGKTLRLIDFGLSGLGGETSGFGDPAKDSGDHQCMVLRDIYALGAMLYFCDTGEQPLKNTDSTIDSKQRLDQASWLNEHAAWVESLSVGDRSFTLICRRALSTSPASRYKSAKELQEDVDAWLKNRPLPHARKNGYSWAESELMLWSRARHGDDLADQAQITGRLCLVVVAIVIGLCGWCSHLMHNGVSPIVAYETAGGIASWISNIIIGFVSIFVRLRKKSIAIFEPVVAALLSQRGHINGGPPVLSVGHC